MPVNPVDSPAAGSVPVAGAAPAPSFGRVMAAVGHVRRAGRWVLPRRFRAVAWMGGVDLDLTEAVIPPEGADLELLAVLGVITVRVPEGLAVELIGDAITWGGPPGWASTRGAAVRIIARAALGTVQVSVVLADRRAAG